MKEIEKEHEEIERERERQMKEEIQVQRELYLRSDDQVSQRRVMEERRYEDDQTILDAF